MNYLAHAYLSFGDPLLLTGNMIADHVKGQKALQHFPERIAAGIRLHRKIDAFADEHPAALRARPWFREAYRLYAGPILDALWDHFLANDPACFASEDALRRFSELSYAQLEDNAAWHPAAFARYFPYMRQHNWLYGYRHLPGTRRSLEGLSRRAAHMPPTDAAYEIFVGHYYELAQCYYELMDALKAFVKMELEA
jgi:acyl carrier protein phosphodiesterase